MTKLPIDEHIPRILAQMAAHNNLVLVAEPGAGKTTRLPPALLSLGKGKVLVLEPRRVAAVAAADRIAAEHGWSLGAEVGYQVRFENKTSRDTRLIFMTEALLARRLLSDPELKEVDVVVLDEFHERSVHVDLALGLLRELQELGRDLKLVVMSATLEAGKISDYLGGAPVVNVPGQLHPLQISYLDKPLRPILDQNFYAAFAQKVKEAALTASGDVLAFLPGVGEIERARERLHDWVAAQKFELVPLHGSLSLEEQRRALRPLPHKRILLATNIAESSLTVDGVTAVVDSGLAKTMRYDLVTGFSRLELGRISLASAKQRAGRAARQAPGHCYRLWTTFDEASMKKDTVPEIARADLGESLLFLAATGVTHFANFAWFEKPRPAQLEKTRQELIDCGAIAASGSITAHGRAMAALPLSPRLANFLLLCARHGQLDDGALLCALLQEREFVKPAALEAYSGDQWENDLALRLHLLREFAKGREQDVYRQTARQILLAAEQLKKLAAPLIESKGLEWPLDHLAVKAFAGNLCRRREASDRALMVGGRGVRLSRESLVRTSEFFLALQGVDMDQMNETMVSLAYGVDPKILAAALGDQIQEHEDLFFDENKGALFQRKVRRYRDLPLEEGRLSPAGADQSAEKLAEFLAGNLELVKKKNENFAHWLERWEAFSAATGDATSISYAELFAHAAMGEKRLEDILMKNLESYAETLLPANTLAQFKRLAPARFIAPTGSKFKIHYPENRAPYVEVRLQELFGTTEHPKLLDGQPLQFHLLGPNYRPVQVTSDLQSFWRNTYPEVRKELRARYPKHSWPEDPLTAPAVKKGRSTK